MSEIIYDLNEIIDFGSAIPEGEYIAKAVNVESGTTKGGDPKIVVTFEVLEGEQRGVTFDKSYYMAVGTTKNGSKFCRGISDLRADAKAIGSYVALPKSFTFAQARKIFAETLCKKKLIVVAGREPDYKDPSKSYPRYDVRGLAGAVAAKEDADPLADLVG